ncbi:MAG: hypothetical protein AAGC55_02900 [Myxococcota bacterium]
MPQTTPMQNADADWQIDTEATQRTYNEWKEEVLQEGLERGRSEGVRQELVASIETFCAACGIELTVERRQQLHSWDHTELTRIQAELFTTRQWPTASTTNE